jgi:LysR family glycine cleavage system transcriptional activator
MQHRLPLNNLNTFAAAAEHLSFQDAAEVLHVTPSAVSHQIRNLEKILGYRLFNRLDRSVSLTPQGKRLFADIETPIKQLHQASRKALRGLEDNTLSLSVAPVFATGWLLQRLKDFYAAYPDISLSVVASTEFADFSSDPFDASIRMGTGEWENTKSIRLIDKELVAVCHPALLKHSKGLLTPVQVAEYPLILNTVMPSTWDEWFQSAGMDMPPGDGRRLQVQSTALAIEAVQSGDSIALVDWHFIQQNIESGRLSIASEHVLKNDEGYFLTFPESAESLPSLQCFRDWLLAQLDLD